MPKLRIFSVKKLSLKAASFPNVKLPESGFAITLTLDNALEALLEDAKIRKDLEASAKAAYTEFLLQTTKQLQKFDKLFAGMLAKGAPAEVVEKQASALQLALEKETPKWEDAAARDLMGTLAKLAKMNR